MEFGHRKFTTSLQVMNESSLHGNSSTNVSWPSSSTMSRQTDEARSYCYLNASLFNNLSSSAVEQFSVYNDNNDNELPLEQANMVGSGRPNQTSVNFVQSVEYPVLEKNILPGLEAPQMHSQTIHGYSFQSATSSSLGWLGNPSLSQDGQLPQMHQPHFGLTKQQKHVLRAQILAFGHLKKGDGTLPFELLQAIVPPPLEEQMLKALMPVERVIQDVSSFKDVDVEDNTRHLRSTEKEPLNVNTKTGVNNFTGKEFVVDEIEILSTNNMQAVTTGLKESTSVVPIGKEEHHQTTLFTATAEYGPEFGTRINDRQTDISLDKGKAVAPEVIFSEMIKVKKPSEVCNATQDKSAGPTRKYYGPLFDTLPLFAQEHDIIASRMMMNNSNNMTLAYDVKDLLFEEGREVLKRKREENIKNIDDILAANMERKRIGSDTVLRLQIEQKKLRLLDVQARLRNEIDYQQQEIMAMPVRPYRKFVRHCERQRRELIRNVQASKKAMRGKQLKSIFQWRKKLLEAHWAIRDARAARNKGVAKYHDRMSREFFKRKDDHHNKRMEALKNNDIERYREILLEQQSIPGDGAERYSVISSFLTQTEEYLRKLGCKITAAKAQQDVEEAANNAAAAARAQGLSEEDVRAAAACAGEEVIIRNRFSEMNTPTDTSSLNKYYNLAHTVNERVLKQPSMLRAGILRDYQLIGLQWMLSLYNNKLNGILADEMGLGKTVQVMSLIAHLMEFKGNCGPHLIIVPNAVLVNWKSELQNWLPSVSCIFYVGGKDQRLKLYSQEVAAKKFNVLVTTYEFIMHDRAKLSKVDWKYIIIDEAHRMKDRESVLARDLDRYRCQRRLLLTGTPLQNDLKELWSLLNLLLPEVFDNRKVFHDWFAKPFQKDVLTNVEDGWLETEKKVIIIHRLHQILEPFMLRRRVEDVEGSLPPKVSIILRCRMSPIQGAVYDWIKSTGTLRLDPDCERLIAQEKPKYQPKVLKTLHNRCMELRKTCNHPSLNYPHFNDFSKDFLVRSCGKLFVLDRILLKLQKAGHRVLLFSTMTKLLDILEEYLQWRRLVYRRIDGTTSLEERESAIVDFNSPDTECFIFLLSIRAAGRGLNLQTADTVIMYDPDPNPKNEEQAIARAHRIGQKREVKVIHLEAVVDKFTSHQVEDKDRSGGNVDSGDDLEGKDRYMGSIESLIRINIQQSKIEMADEVINAGRFDQRTTHEERRLTLESMLHDEDRYQETVHSVPSLQEVNRMIARGQEEVELFDQMDEEFDWVEEMTGYDEVPKWLWVDTDEMDATITSLSKKSSKKISLGENVGVIFDETKPMGTRGRPRGAKIPVYIEVDEDDGSEASSEEGSEYSGVAEEETGLLEDDVSGDVEAPSRNMDTKSNKHPTELDETENAISGGSLMYLQKPGSLIHDVAEGEHEQMLLTETKRKRSTRNRSRHTEERSQIVREVRLLGESNALKSDKSSSSLKAERHPHPGKVPIPRKVHTSLGPSRVSHPSEDAGAHTREIKCNKTMRANDSSLGSTMSDEVQHRCRNLMRKFQKKIEKEGPQVVPLLTKFWKRNEQKRGCGKGDLDIQKIDQRLDKFKYKGVMELVSDVQLMLKRAVQFYELSYEVRTEARKVHDLFFDILRLAFPNMDFEEARNAVCFTAQVNRSTSVGPSKHGLAGHKRQKQPNEVDLHEIRTQKRSTSHTSQHEGSAIHHVDRPGIPGLVGWSNSAKRIRTGSRRRRPSQV